MTMRKLAALILALVLCLGTVSVANAATEYPPRPSGAVSDLAGVLGEQTIQDLETLNERLNTAMGGGLYVLTRHFLGGANAQQYADKVFEVWALGTNDALLLMVIGEETYALSLGDSAKKAVPGDIRNSLLATHFRSDYLNRDYDEALADLAVNLAKANNASVNTAGLFGQAAIRSTPQPQTANDWWYGMFAKDDYDARESENENYWRNWQNNWRNEESSINWRSVIIWAVVIYFLFFRRRKRRERRRDWRRGHW